ncbi:MAG: ATP-binding protein, partial [Verrucomicrobiota bacterium]
LNYAAPDQVLVRTRLERDGELLVEHHGPERAASYELLPPGRYSVSITAANEDGVPAPEAIRARFEIGPFFWQTTWFRLGLGLAGLGLVLGAAGYWVRHVRLAAKLALAERDRVAALEGAEKAEALRRSEVRREKAEAEAEWRRQREAVLRDVHDGVGGLVANLHMTTSLALRAPDAAEQRAQIQHLDAMAHEALLEVRSLMDALEVQVADVEGVAGEFERYGNLVLGPHGIRLAVSAEMEDGCPQACGPLFLGLFRIVKEALANVVKHSGASSVEVRVVASRDGLVLAIGDDGRGLLPGCGKGRGLLSMRRRAEELGGKMTLDSGAGLRLQFSVPWPGHDAGRANEARRGTDLRPSVSPA